MTCVEQLADNTAPEGQAERTQLSEVLNSQIKTFIKHLSDL